MGKSASELTQELENTRADAAEKIEKIEQQVTESAEAVKQNLDWRYQVESRPLTAVGVAFVGGMLLGGLTGGGGGGSHRSAYDAAGTRVDYSEDHHRNGGISGALKQATQSSGLEAAISSAAATAMAAAGQRVKDAIGEKYPDLIDQYEASKSSNGSTATNRHAEAVRTLDPAGGPVRRPL